MYLLDQHFKTNFVKSFLKDEMRLKVFEIVKALTKCCQSLFDLWQKMGGAGGEAGVGWGGVGWGGVGWGGMGWDGKD